MLGGDASSLLALAAFSAVACGEGDSSSSSSSEPVSPPNSRVLSLTDETLSEALQAHRLLLVEFYAPRCGHCKSLEPEYEAAARLLEAEGSDIRLAKIDATAYPHVTAEYGVPGFPTLLFFIENRGSKSYDGLRKAEAIVTWLKKKLGPQADTLNDKADVERLKSRKIAVVGFFQRADGPAAEALLAVADKMEKHTFGMTTSLDLRREYGVDPDGDSIVLFKQFDDGRADFSGGGGGGELTVASIEAFVKKHSLPLVTEFHPDSAREIFSSDVQGHLLMFASKKTDAYKQLLANARQIAGQYVGKIRFVVVDTEHEEAKDLTDYFGVKTTRLPAYRMVSVGVSEMRKYKADTEDVSPAALDAFAARYLAGEVQIFRLSEDLPADWDAKPVKVLVATNYQAVVKDSGKRVLVEYYAPWCSHCKQLAPIWEQLGEKYKDVSDLMIAKLDVVANEIAGLSIDAYPTIKFFVPGQEKEIDYSGPRTLEGLSKFVESDGKEGGAGDKDEEEGPKVAEGELIAEESHESAHIEL